MFFKNYTKLFSVLEAKQKIRIGYFGFFNYHNVFRNIQLCMFYPFLQSITNNSLNQNLKFFKIFY